ncbi:amino acid ABC transporter permease [Variovorax guangxiensis]|uniref:Glutamate/aspartate import permease protein GltK n=1 Tax=Variovorax guangxiensis TaxID=1775474 RepID=A0A502DQX6_9BURK|nr:amino acid ABC transporter permease [Variovorax guangxiensis]TPG22935.1 amino acid ABC transporter permease [Variovorax ginsengisoli]TPG27484.1 amino acid ABC transporter permease [Variovorax guangxiensis]
MFNVDAFLSYLINPYLLGGVGITIGLTISTIFIGLALALPLALASMSTNKFLRAPAKCYIWVFRGTPLLVQIVIIYTGLPQLGVRFDVLTSAILALSLNEAAYLSETIRAGFSAVAKGQIEAAKALSLSKFATLRLVTLPQVIRIIIPPLGNSVNGLLKATSLASVISMEELMRRSQVLMQAKFEVLELYCVAAVFYLVLTSLWDVVQRRLEKHYGKGYAPTEKKKQTVVRTPAVA